MNTLEGAGGGEVFCDPDPVVCFESGPLRADYLSRHKWPGGFQHLSSTHISDARVCGRVVRVQTS